MITVSSNILILFFSASVIVFLFRFVKDKEWQKLDLKPLGSSLKALASVVMPFALMLCGLYFVEPENAFPAAGYFCAGAIVPYLLSQIGLSPFPRALLLLMICVGASVGITAEHFEAPLIGTLAGMTFWKCAENLLQKSDFTLEDILPSALWLAGAYWIKVAGVYQHPEIQTGLLLGTISVAILLRWVQTPLLPNDKVYLKRIVLAITGGLAVLIVVTKLLLSTSLTTIASLAGAGFFLTYLFEAIDKGCERPADEPPSAVKAFKTLIFIGIFTLLATRLFGNEGLLVLAATAIVAGKPGTAQIAAFYWCGRVLLQAFVFQYNPNVTGINLMHAYTSAALYAGIVLVVAVSIFVRDIKDRRILTAVFLAVAAIAPAASCFFLHEEPTGALLDAGLIAGVLMSVMANAIYQRPVEEHENLILLPVQMICFGLLTSDLISKGNQAGVNEKMTAIGVLAFIGLCAALVNHFVVQGGPGAKVAPASGPE